jgi:DNA-binding GntR family transcriptional regulator
MPNPPKATNPKTPAPVRRRSAPAPHRVSDQLRQAIVSGEFLDGERLVVDELARRYRTSTMPVRQALQHLESEGLVVVTQNRGARVRTVDRALAENLYDLRRAVLGLLVERCAERITDEQYIELEALGVQTETASSAEEGFTKDEAFFAKIAEIADIPQAAEVLARSWPLMCAVRRVYGVRDRSVTRNSHQRLLDAIRRRAPSEAVSVSEEAVLSAKSDLLTRIGSRKGAE